MALATCVGGCQRSLTDVGPGRLHQWVEPEQNTAYLLYQPSDYRRDYQWPLVVVCHAGGLDSPAARVRRWAPLAEERGFLLAVPSLTSSSGRGDAAERMAGQARDERGILAVIRHVRGSCQVSDDRLFITGRGGGALPALYAGIRNPAVFRAVAVAAPEFNADAVADATQRLDPYQSVLVNYPMTDALWQKSGRACAAWVSTYMSRVTEDHGARAGGDVERRIVEYFEHVVAAEPWLHVSVWRDSPSDDLTVHFKLRSSFVPKAYRWDFGDGQSLPIAEPVHRYREPGVYVVTLTITPPKGKPEQRRVRLRVPEGIASPGNIE
ncbi:MAG: PKD domain-containing protein [Phycisphaerales bacterium]|nr:MAG: PKD domain-containing protein [Phycisphaerales bacterium]